MITINLFRWFGHDPSDRLQRHRRELLEADCTVTVPREWDDPSNAVVVDIDPEAAE